MSLQQRILHEAVAFAARAHEGQRRKDGRTPYVSHVLRVCLIVSETFGFHDCDILAAAVLHDTIEDTTTDYDDVAAVFGVNVANWVRSLSKDKRLPEAEREDQYGTELVHSCWQVQVIKLADILDNYNDAAGLAPDRRESSLKRMREYLRRLQENLHSESRGAFAIVNDKVNAKK